MNERMERWVSVAVSAVSAMLTAWFLTGCASVTYDGTGFTSRTLGKDLNIGNGTWTKITSNSAETITFSGGAGSSSAESTHMIGNVSMAAIGALIGSSAGPAGTGIGAASGASVAEIWQAIQDYLKGKQVASTNAPVVIPVVTPTTSTTTTTTQPATPAVSYGAPCNEPKSDCYTGSEEGRFGSNPPIAVISENTDKVLDAWAAGFFTRNPDGTATALQTLVAPSGKVYVTDGWRIARSSNPLLKTLTVTLNTDDNVTRLYVVCHNAN